jgi:anti-sigma regulatory factor (Ser/Thr protein kinase)
VTPNAAGSTFSMTSEAEHLLRLRKWLREQLAGHGVPKQEQPTLLLAVGELCANSIQHAYEGRAGQPIKVSVRSSDDSLVIEVEDFGKPFDAERYQRPDLEAVPDSGYGIFLVKTIADSLSIDVARERGTRWTMVKYRQGRGPAATPADAPKA